MQLFIWQIANYFLAFPPTSQSSGIIIYFAWYVQVQSVTSSSNKLYVVFPPTDR